MDFMWADAYVAYQEFLNQGDPRVKNWPLVSSPFNAIGAVVIYVLFVKVFGPKWMKNREPFHLKFLMLAFNAGLVLANLYVFIQIGRLGWFAHYSLRCQPVDYSNSKNAIEMASALWFLWILKFIELFDTVFFVLRKKFKHVNALQVVHHGLVPIGGWYLFYFAPGGYNAFHPWINALVHIVMYFYYFLAVLGPKVQKYLWWKKYLTTFQIFQFVIDLIYFIQLLFRRDCPYYTSMLILNITVGSLFLAMFLNFYVSEYNRLKKQPKKTE